MPPSQLLGAMVHANGLVLFVFALALEIYIEHDMKSELASFQTCTHHNGRRHSSGQSHYFVCPSIIILLPDVKH